MQLMQHGSPGSHAVLAFKFAICCRTSVSLSVVCRLTFVHRIQSVKIFGNVSTSFGTLAIR